MESKEIIKLEQTPVIVHRLEEIGKSVTERIAALNIEKQVATEDSIGVLKRMRAELNADAKSFEDQRKFVKDAIMHHYNDFEAIYKAEIIDKFKTADKLLNLKIGDFEMTIKTEKRKNLIDYFNEFCETTGIDWLTFDRLGIDVNLSTSEKKNKEQILETLNKIVDDLDLIQSENFAAEILVEYKNNLNAAQSITLIRQRKANEKAEKERLIAERTSKRVRSIQSLNFVYSDIAKAYYYVRDNSITVALTDIETLENDEWMKRFAELESKSKIPEQSKPEVVKAPNLFDATQKAPEQPKAPETFKAIFEVTDTMERLTALGAYLKANNYEYKNL
ncbi:hypothetical protein AGMMS4957_19610 [Bacteroidia bacterium]|nr:hypothetical protein AGMMS4957_19610 [Bacteroidia bacterium]